MTDKDLAAIIVAAVSGLAGVALGIVGTLIASSLQFKREKTERRNTELREALKQTWLFFNRYADQMAQIRDLAGFAVARTTSGKFIELEEGTYEKLKLPLDQVTLHLLVYVPDGKKQYKMIEDATNKLVDTYTKLFRSDVLTEQRLFFKEVSEQSKELIDLFESIKIQVIDLIHQL